MSVISTQIHHSGYKFPWYTSLLIGLIFLGTKIHFLATNQTSTIIITNFLIVTMVFWDFWIDFMARTQPTDLHKELDNKFHNRS
jgi:phosphoglycerol transferase MdoB-like AlkP superfamily enzyme